MTDLLKWAVMVQLRRANPALPPRAKVGTAQRRLDAAFKIAKIALSDNNYRDWAAIQILDLSRWPDPLLNDLADRLARAIWYEQPNEIAAEAWFYLYMRANSAAAHGFSPHGWEDIFPTDATIQPFPVDVTPFRRELLRLAAELDGSFELNRDEIVPKPCLTGRAVRLINRLAELNLPIPMYRGKEYEGSGGLLDLAFLRLCLLRGSVEHATATARHIGKNLVNRSITSGHIYGPGIACGQAMPWETKPRILKLELDPRITAGVNPTLVAEVESALCRAIA
jgi:hypothetical protein